MTRNWFGIVIVCCAVVPLPALALQLDVNVSGVQGELQRNVLALLRIYQERTDDDLTAERIAALHRQAPEQITAALEPFGYYQITIDAQLHPRSAQHWLAQYRIALGQPVTIAAVNYQLTGAGATNPQFPRQFPLRVGAVLRHADYTAARNELERIAAQEGYLDAELVRHEVVIDPDTTTATIDIALDTGPRYYLGPVTFNQTLLAPQYLARFVPFQPGDVYDPAQLLTLQGRLLGSEYFDRVEIKPHKELMTANQRVPLTVTAHTNRANKYRVGLGMATDVGPRLTLDYRRRYLTAFGHKLKTEMTIAAAAQTITAEYRIPIYNPLQDYLLIRPDMTAQDTETRSGSAFRLQAAQSIQQRTGWRRTIGLDYRYEDYTVRDTSTDNNQFTGIVPSIAWATVVADDPVNTQRGYRARLLLQGTTTALFAPSHWISATATGKWITSPAERYRFIARADLGAIWAAELADVPISQRFFAGGDNSVRGFGFDTQGPADPMTRATIGGRYLAVGSIEIERHLSAERQRGMSIALFTDYGNAFDPDYDSEWHHSIGVGLRYLTPLGRIRLDVAHALTKDDPGARLHLVIGPDL